MGDQKYLKNLDKYIEGSRVHFVDMLGQLVEIPTVSMDPGRKGDMRRGANLAAEYLRAFGAEATVHETSGNPVVVGRFQVPGARQTLTVYNHMDVQPAQEPEWVREPFVFVKQDGRYLGRGTTDDKGPGLTALLGARYAVENGVPLNIQFIWELEEEIGSPHFEEFMKANAASLKTDSVLVSDTMWISRNKPAIPYGLRGMITALMVLQTHEKDTHSGVTGGAARNPLGELCQVVAQCYDAKTGKVKIPGFYQDVKAVSKKEVDSFLSSGFDMKRWKQVYSFRSLRANTAVDLLKRVWTMPTFEVHGLVGGYTGPGVKTVVPPRGELKFSCRLVPNQKPEKIFKLIKSYVKKLNPDVEVILDAKLDPYLGDLSGDHIRCAIDAIEYGFSRSPAFIREGGSIGAVVTMQRYLKAPIIFIGLSLPEHGYHAPNENFDWVQASGGIKTFAKYFANVAAL
ncbi:M20/M25/M40 family metallo-hydrolase [bacterium]|nr:M20/M25/M40 family metallo-hydrolase [bacterium]